MNPITGVPTWVDYMLAAAAILGAIAWPLVVMVVLLAFRKPLRDALEHLIEFRFGNATVKFDRAAADVSANLIEAIADSDADASEEPDVGDVRPRPQLRDLYAAKAQENPLNALLEGFIAIEVWFDQLLTERGESTHEGARKRSVQEMAAIAVERGFLPRQLLDTVQGLGIVRDLAIRDREKVTPNQAREFLLLADAFLGYADLEARKTAKESKP
ncbi:hypothetical protein [Homoserinibacter sp. GY 40078]|uniref:hypothetical protein n=1 Tax=Homoserinibacter sp. GY 40078 TaxID=2603275 RepID=UPI0011C898D1|nr:hypothetical protein [Homoserinibacter sp. GY 40078]TXK17427.1 hypothetical protein FVQ89_11385 [Homoserinibacter sp. GY 40078]